MDDIRRHSLLKQILVSLHNNLKETEDQQVFSFMKGRRQKKRNSMGLQSVYTFEQAQTLTLKAEEAEKLSRNSEFYHRNEETFASQLAAQTVTQPVAQVAMLTATQVKKQPATQP